MATKSRGSRQPLTISAKKFIDKYVYRIDLDADYQREKVWSRDDQEKLLDSMLRDIDIPKLYLAKVRNGRQFDYECIDGKQRMLTLLTFLKPDKDEERPLTVAVLNKQYTYKQLKREHPKFAEQIDQFPLNFIVYDQENLNDEFVRLIFRRLQLGIRLNSGEVLNSLTGAIRNFVYKENGDNGPYLGKTNLSEKRYSRQFTLSQICINSFARKEIGDYVRARLVDIENFFGDWHDISKNDGRLKLIRQVLKILDREFGDDASKISSRAVAVSAYLFAEELYINNKKSQISIFAKFYVKLLDSIKHNMKLLASFKRPDNPRLLEEFQKYVMQASVEPYAIRRRHEFLVQAFQYYRKTKTIIGAK